MAGGSTGLPGPSVQGSGDSGRSRAGSDSGRGSWGGRAAGPDAPRLGLSWDHRSSVAGGRCGGGRPCPAGSAPSSPVSRPAVALGLVVTTREWPTCRDVCDALWCHPELPGRLVEVDTLPLRGGPPRAPPRRSDFGLLLPQTEPDLEKGLEMRKWVLSGILASEETYLSHLEALLLVRRVRDRAGGGSGGGSGGGAGARGAVSSHGPGRRSAGRGRGHPPSWESRRHLWEGQGRPPGWRPELPRGHGWQHKTGANPSWLHMFIVHGI